MSCGETTTAFGGRALLVLVLGTGCASDSAVGPPSRPPIVEGGICGTFLGACLDADDILRCDGRRWTRHTCNEICGSRTALGCDFASHDGSCICGDEPDAASCLNGETRCGGPDLVLTCASGVWASRSCEEVCAEDQAGYRSAGCRHAAPDGCVCTVAGTPCVGEAPFCASPTELASCKEGTVALVDCGAGCPNTLEGRCTSFAAADAGGACTCGP